MVRLTKALSGKGGKYVFDLLDTQIVADKLGLLEDIEEELGIDLVKLLSLKECDTLYCKYKGKILIGMFSSTNFGTAEIDVEGRDICDSPKYDMDCLVFKLKDYGKTWAFTKKELE